MPDRDRPPVQRRCVLSTRIGLISDVHASPRPLREALQLFNAEGVDEIFCLGDIAGYGHALDKTVALLRDAGCRAVIGNHDLWCLESDGALCDTRNRDYLWHLPGVLTRRIEGHSLYLVHASPPASVMDGIRLLDESGQMLDAEKDAWSRRLAGFGYDILLVGHTHQVFAEPVADTLVINPGSTLFNHACAVLSLPEKQVRFFGLSGRQPLPAWHWGQGWRAPPSR